MRILPDPKLQRRRVAQKKSLPELFQSIEPTRRMLLLALMSAAMIVVIAAVWVVLAPDSSNSAVQAFGGSSGVAPVNSSNALTGTYLVELSAGAPPAYLSLQQNTAALGGNISMTTCNNGKAEYVTFAISGQILNTHTVQLSLAEQTTGSMMTTYTFSRTDLSSIITLSWSGADGVIQYQRWTHTTLTDFMALASSYCQSHK